MARKKLCVSCTKKERQLLDLKLKYLEDRDTILGNCHLNRSEYLVKIILLGLHQKLKPKNYLDYSMKGDRVNFQISMSEREYQVILEMLEDLGVKKKFRSQWIMDQLLRDEWGKRIGWRVIPN